MFARQRFDFGRSLSHLINFRLFPDFAEEAELCARPRLDRGFRRRRDVAGVEGSSRTRDRHPGMRLVLDRE